EEAVILVVGAGGEEERVGRPVVRRSLAELERPEAVDRQRAAVRSSQLAARLEAPVRLALESRDPTVTEVPDEEIAAEAPERGRRHREAPGRVQLPAGRYAPEERPARVELVHEAEPRPRDVVLPVGVLLRVCDEDVAADVLDSERREARWDTRIDERSGHIHLAEAPVEDVDLSIVEIGRVQAVTGDCEPLEDGV